MVIQKSFVPGGTVPHHGKRKQEVTATRRSSTGEGDGHIDASLANQSWQGDLTSGTEHERIELVARRKEAIDLRYNPRRAAERPSLTASDRELIKIREAEAGQLKKYKTVAEFMTAIEVKRAQERAQAEAERQNAKALAKANQESQKRETKRQRRGGPAQTISKRLSGLKDWVISPDGLREDVKHGTTKSLYATVLGIAALALGAAIPGVDTKIEDAKEEYTQQIESTPGWSHTVDGLGSGMQVLKVGNAVDWTDRNVLQRFLDDKNRRRAEAEAETTIDYQWRSD